MPTLAEEEQLKKEIAVLEEAIQRLAEFGAKTTMSLATLSAYGHLGSLLQARALYRIAEALNR